MKDHSITPAATQITATDNKPQLLRLTILLSPTKENSKALNDIATYAETKLAVARGYRLITTSIEIIHAIETYGSTGPSIPKPERASVARHARLVK